MDFAKYDRKSGVLDNSKVYWNKRHCYISKKDEMYNILKSG